MEKGLGVGGVGQVERNKGKRRLKIEIGSLLEEAFKNSVSVAGDGEVPAPNRLLTVECTAEFQDGIYRLLHGFPWIRKEVGKIHGLHGRALKEFVESGEILKCNKVNKFRVEIFDWFTKSQEQNRTLEALTELIFERLHQTFRAILLHGSPYRLACELFDLYEECLEKSSSRRGVEAPPKAKRLKEGHPPRMEDSFEADDFSP